jgi:transposase
VANKRSILTTHSTLIGNQDSYESYDITLLLKIIKDQQAHIHALEKRIEELEARLNQTSSNSHLPPSSDKPWNKTPKPSTPRNKGERKPGGQKGHKGETLRQSDTPTEVIEHGSDVCEHCGMSLKEVKGTTSERRQVMGVRVEPNITEHQVQTKECPFCHTKTKGNFPPGIDQPVQYDSSVLGLASYLNNYAFIPYDQLGEIFEDIFNLPVSPGTLVAANNRLSSSLEYYEACIKELLKAAPVLHCDETGFRIHIEGRWLHVASTENLTLYHPDRCRGMEATKNMGILPNFQGVAVHDCYRSYYQFKGCKHALCIAHLIRELRGIEENQAQQWASEMLDLFETMHGWIEETKFYATSLEPHIAGTFEAEFDRIWDMGIADNPPPIRSPTLNRRGRIRQTKAKNLLDRLNRYREDIFRCIHDFSVPFTNNQAERDLRMMKVKLKRSGAFRTEDGAREFCRIRGYISTCKKMGVSPHQAIQDAMKGRPFIPVFSTPE